MPFYNLIKLYYFYIFYINFRKLQNSNLKLIIRINLISYLLFRHVKNIILTSYRNCNKFTYKKIIKNKLIINLIKINLIIINLINYIIINIIINYINLKI